MIVVSWLVLIARNFSILLFLFLMSYQYALAIEPSFRVALVDRFYPGSQSYASPNDHELDIALHGMFDLDDDGLKEPLFHGDVVQAILSHPEIKVLRYDLPHGMKPIEGILARLEDIRRELFWEEPIDAVLLPWESSTLVSAFDIALSNTDAELYLDKLRVWSVNDKAWSTTLEIIQALEDIVEYGGKVYTIAGNGGMRMVNTYSFARGVVTVGAVEAELAHFVANNAFVDVYAVAAYVPRRVDVPGGEVLGYDLNGNGCPDVLMDQLSGEGGKLPRHYWKPIKGSSFAAPAALKRHLVGEWGHEC